MNESNILFKTWSVCPICMKRIPAERVAVGKEVFLRKSCGEHGAFETIIWRGYSEINDWIENQNISLNNEPQCPDNCGLCEDHQQKTCCILLNITDSCNLNCEFCLANQCNGKDDPTFDEIIESLYKLIDKGKTLVQLSGGEPTLRDDLPEIVKVAKQAGAKYVQLNSNGVRLGEDKTFVEKLADAGLSFVFMQFDGTEDSIHQKLRNSSLLEIKQKAIENCAEFNIGVTLVPTLVRGVNIQNIGDIVRFAISQSPKVRGVHFQPVSYFGRVPQLPTNDERFTLDELVFEIQKQTDGIIKANDLLLSCCDHPLCGFHGDFVIDQNHKITPLSKRGNSVTSCCDPTAADKNREFVARRWQRPTFNISNVDSNHANLQDMEYFLKRVKTHGFTITAMAFQDAGNIDFSRLRKCSFHVYDKGRFVPFCAHYLSSWKN